MTAKFEIGAKVHWSEGYVNVAGIVEQVGFNLYGGQANYHYAIRVNSAEHRPDTPAYSQQDPTWRVGGLAPVLEFQLSEAP